MRQGATGLLEELIGQLGEQSGPIERVIDVWRGAEVVKAAGSVERGAPRETSLEVIEELGKTWGPTGDPSWVDGLVPGRPDDHDAHEIDFMFSLYRRPGIYAYARLRGEPSETPSSMRLILGVLRKPPDQ